MDKLMSLFAAILFMVSIAGAQIPTGTVNVIGTKLVDSTGVGLVNGTIYFAPVDTNGNPISYHLNTSGQVLSRPVQATVTNGAFTVNLADTSLTVPTNVCFSVSIIDNATGENVLGGGYSCVQPSSVASWCPSSVCDLDNFVPNLAPLGIVYPVTTSVGTVTNTFPGLPAIVTNVGSPTAAVLNFVLPQGIQGPIGAPTSGVNLTSPTTQTIVQNPNTSLNISTSGTGKTNYNGNELVTRANAVQIDVATNQSVKLLNGMANASLYTGSDIGAKVNAAIANITCGTVFIPSGTYTQTTQITKPACISIKGQSSLSTVLNWTPTTGTALVIADPNQVYANNEVSDITLNGPGASSAANGLFIGGDPAALLSPATDWGNHQNFNRIVIQNFGLGVNFGNNAFEIGFEQSAVTNNGTGVAYAPTGTPLNNSGESISFTASSIQNNSVQGINLIGYSDFYFYGSRCDYNTTCGTIGGAVTAHFFGEHFEQSSNTILTIGSTAGAPDGRLNAYIYGGQMLLTGTSGTDAQMINVIVGFDPSLTLDGTMVASTHSVTNVVTWGPIGSTGFSLDLSRADIVGTEFTNITSNCAFAECSIKNAKYIVSPVSAASVAGNTCAFQDMGVPGIRPGDLVQSVTKATQQAGLAVIGAAQAAGADHLSVQFCNVTAATIFPTTGDTYTFLVHQ